MTFATKLRSDSCHFRTLESFFLLTYLFTEVLAYNGVSGLCPQSGPEAEPWSGNAEEV